MNSRDFDECLEKARAEQRQMCVDKMLSALSSDCIKLVIDEAQLRKACINAVEEK